MRMRVMKKRRIMQYRRRKEEKDALDHDF